MKRLLTALAIWALALAPSHAATGATRGQMLATAQNIQATATWLGNFFVTVIDSLASTADSNTWQGTNTFADTTYFTANPPSATSCGTSPSIASGSNAQGGQFTLGTGTPTACTITFATPFPNNSYCTLTPASSGGAAISGGYYISAESATAFTLTLGTGTSSLVFNYSCTGN
jgi:hypothetical protein